MVQVLLMVMQAVSRRLIDGSSWSTTSGLVGSTVGNGRIMHYVPSRLAVADYRVTRPRNVDMASKNYELRWNFVQFSFAQ